MPDEIEAGRLINRYGATAVYGRPLGISEMRRINLAENVERVSRRWQAKGAGAWFAEHPEDQRLLQWVVKVNKHA